MPVWLIVNTTSVRPAVAKQLADAVAGRIPAANIMHTSTLTEVRRFAATAKTRGVRRVVFAGGDGTMQLATDQFAGTGIEVALLPLGSGNDFARTFGLPTALEVAVDVALGRVVVPIDVGLIHCRDDGFRAVKYRFANIAEAGFGAQVVRRAERARRWVGRDNAYRAGILLSLRKLSTPKVRLWIDGVDIGIAPTANLIVGNAQYFGGGLRPLPQARVDDGLFDIVRMRDVSRIDIARHAKALNGIPKNHPRIDHWRARRIEATSDEPVPIEADGTLIGWLPAAFEVQPGSLRLVVP